VRAAWLGTELVVREAETGISREAETGVLGLRWTEKKSGRTRQDNPEKPRALLLWVSQLHCNLAALQPFGITCVYYRYPLVVPMYCPSLQSSNRCLTTGNSRPLPIKRLMRLCIICIKARLLVFAEFEV